MTSHLKALLILSLFGIMSHSASHAELKELEKLSGLSAVDAKKLLIQSLENEAKHDAQVSINRIEQEAGLIADKKARDIIIIRSKAFGAILDRAASPGHAG